MFILIFACKNVYALIYSMLTKSDVQTCTVPRINILVNEDYCTKMHDNKDVLKLDKKDTVCMHLILMITTGFNFEVDVRNFSKK